MAEKKIMDILWVLRPLRGGMRTHVHKILQHLDATRVRVAVAAPAAVGDVLDGHRPRVLRRWHRLPEEYPTSPLIMWRAARNLRRLSRRCTMIHAHGLWAGLLLLAADVRTPEKRPALVTIHTLVRSIGARIAAGMLAKRHNLQVCAVSGAVRKTLRDLPAPVHVIPNGTERPSVVRIPGSGPVRLLYVGRFHHSKGLDILLTALCRLHALPWTLCAVGDGPLRDRYRRAAASMGLQGRIEWCGWREDVAPHYRCSDLLVSPSRSEASGLAVSEAMTYGVVPVAARIGGTPELVEHARSGWLVPPDDPRALADALARLLTDGKMRRQLGLGARRRSRQLPAWRQVAVALEELYAEMCAGGKH